MTGVAASLLLEAGVTGEERHNSERQQDEHEDHDTASRGDWRRRAAGRCRPAVRIVAVNQAVEVIVEPVGASNWTTDVLMERRSRRFGGCLCR